MGKTMSEKILSNHSGKDVKAGDFVIVDVDFIMATDTTAPLAIKAFYEMNGKKVFNPKRFAVIMDHATPSPNQKIANLHKYIRDFAEDQGIILYDMGNGICHQLMIENGHVKEGDLVIGADSHTCTYGGLGAFSTGVGATDLAGIMLTGKTWMQVPFSIKVYLKGQFNDCTYAKDLILYLIGKLGANGANYMTLEFSGPACKNLSTDDRLTISNMAIEMGAKAGMFSGNRIEPDSDALYKYSVEIDLSLIEPQIALPHTVDNVVSVQEVEGTEIHQVFLGSCTNGRYSDLEIAAEILKGKKIHPGVRLIIAPASRDILIKAIKTGIMETLIKAGGTLIPPGCGPCVGTLGGIPADDENVLSTSNRNFKGRMGNNRAGIYLASPATAAASALLGKITDPRKVWRDA
jgi:3-isopropylmalate/(R)-2-methylmalate dehydratase large subunit